MQALATDRALFTKPASASRECTDRMEEGQAQASSWAGAVSDRGILYYRTPLKKLARA